MKQNQDHILKILFIDKLLKTPMNELLGEPIPTQKKFVRHNDGTMYLITGSLSNITNGLLYLKR